MRGDRIYKEGQKFEQGCVAMADGVLAVATNKSQMPQNKRLPLLNRNEIR